MECFFTFSESYSLISRKLGRSAWEKETQKRKLATSTLYSEYFTRLLGGKPEETPVSLVLETNSISKRLTNQIWSDFGQETGSL